MIKLRLKAGDILEVEKGVSGEDIAKQISMGLFRAATSTKVNGQICDLRDEINEDSDFEILTFNDKEGKEAYWHTASHILAQAVKRLYPEAKLAIGPAIEDGFYYDIDIENPFNSEELEKIEVEMKKIIKEKFEIEKFYLPVSEAIKLMEEKNEDYKVELINDLKESGEEICFYKQGEFVDLCAGPHLLNTGNLKAIKLLQATGAYWRGDANNKSLTRVYGIAFQKQSELDNHLKMLEEAKERDHNKLGRELEIFTTSSDVGQGLPILLPKGARILQLLQRFVEDEEEKRGWLLTKTPFMAKSDLYKISGHWDLYKNDMFVIGDEEKDKEVFALRPMTCPFQYQAYLNRKRSYRDLPIRYNETSTLFRNESSGEMHGLIRIRQFTLSEGHLMCRPDQLEDEFKNCLDLTKYMLETLGLYDDISYRFSQWDPAKSEKYMGTAEEWTEVQDTMKKILEDLNIEYEVGIGDAAFYGPKLDLQIKNVYGKEDTLITIQIDQMLAKTFGMEYTDKDGSEKHPYIIHRSSIGCYERTLALLIEKYAGAFPVWLAPTQVRILPVSEKYIDYADEIYNNLKKAGFRVELDDRNEKLGYKIRESQVQKIPYFLIVGENERDNKIVSLRRRNDQKTEEYTIDDFINMIGEKNNSKTLEI